MVADSVFLCLTEVRTSTRLGPREKQGLGPEMKCVGIMALRRPVDEMLLVRDGRLYHGPLSWIAKFWIGKGSPLLDVRGDPWTMARADSEPRTTRSNCLKKSDMYVADLPDKGRNRWMHVLYIIRCP